VPVNSTAEQGIHPGIEDADYRKWPFLSPSKLWHGLESMLQLKACIDGELDTDSDDKKFGRDFHTRLLEPKRFKADYVVIPDFANDPENVTGNGDASTSPATKYVKGKTSAFMAEYGEGVTFIEQCVINDIDRMAKSVYGHPVAKLFHAAGGCEVAILGEIKGVHIKGKVDKLITEGMHPTIVDVKKIGRRATRRLCENACNDFGYVFKASLYVDLAAQHLNVRPNFVWVFIEDSPPYDVFVMQLDDESYAIAQAEVGAVLHQYKHALETKVWPGRCSDVEMGGYPAWKIAQAKRGGVTE
jgi:hypothetical protein